MTELKERMTFDSMGDYFEFLVGASDEKLLNTPLIVADKGMGQYSALLLTDCPMQRDAVELFMKAFETEAEYLSPWLVKLHQNANGKDYQHLLDEDGAESYCAALSVGDDVWELGIGLGGTLFPHHQAED